MALPEFSGFTARATRILELGPGVAPIFHQGDTKHTGFAAPYLPVLETVEDGRGNHMPIVIQAGMMVGVDEYGFIVPATGYYTTSEGVTMTYAANDATYKVIDYDNITDAYMFGAEKNWTEANMAAPSAGASTRKLKTVHPIGIACSNVYPHPQVLRRYGSYNFSNQKPPLIKLGCTFELPILCANTAAAKAGDLMMVGKPTSDTFSAANYLTMGRLVPVNVTDAVGNSQANINTVIAEAESVLKSAVAKCLYIRRIDNVTNMLDKYDVPPNSGFQTMTSTPSHITSYANLPEHLRDAQELQRTIGAVTPTATWGLWSITVNLIMS